MNEQQINQATDAIKAFLDKKAAEDPLFSVTYAKEGKSIDGCFNYVYQQAHKRANGQRCIAMTDDEVYSLAVHYYDEDDTDERDTAGVAYSAHIQREAANVELTEEEKAEVKERAIRIYQDKCIAEEKAKAAARAEEKKKAKAEAKNAYRQTSFFDMMES